MCKCMIAIAAVVALVSGGLILSNSARAGASASAASKYSGKSPSSVATYRPYVVRDVTFTDFSSSSPRRTAPKR